jgi:hypothetical protein
MIFPSNPIVGQEFKPSSNHPTYVWNGRSWKAVTVAASKSEFYYRATAPTQNLNKGDLWFNTSNGNTYAYAHDGDVMFWLQINT